MPIQPDYALIPGVDRLLSDPSIQVLRDRCGVALLTDLIRRAVDDLRGAMQNGHAVGETREALIGWVVDRVAAHLADLSAPNLKRVINATGIILHTNQGRAPLPKAAIQHMSETAGRFCNLEIDLDSGARGSRTTLVEDLLCELTGAEAAAVVNNNAAAVLLTLNTLALGKEAIVSRGQLVEIGGSFRIPDIMSRSGAQMVEVGTTNRTHLRDYEDAITDQTGLMLAVHPSNYRVQGFTAEVQVADLVALGKRCGVPVAQDLGGGVMVDLRDYGLPYEPLVADSVRAGVDAVMFSGDKVLGGPQAGILVGRKAAIEAVRKNPLMRALRCGKLTYAALEATLRLFRNPERLTEANPTLKMLREPVKTLRSRARRLRKLLADVGGLEVEVVDAVSQMGSGALPLEEIPSIAVSIALPSGNVNDLAARLRRHDPPVVGYVRDDRLFLNLRTVWPDEIQMVAAAVQEAMS